MSKRGQQDVSFSSSGQVPSCYGLNSVWEAPEHCALCASSKARCKWTPVIAGDRDVSWATLSTAGISVVCNIACVVKLDLTACETTKTCCSHTNMLPKAGTARPWKGHINIKTACKHPAWQPHDLCANESTFIDMHTCNHIPKTCDTAHGDVNVGHMPSLQLQLLTTIADINLNL